MLIYKRGTINSRILIIGTVIRNSEEQLDFKAFAYKLTKDEINNNPNTSEFKQFCNQFVEADCDWRYFESWNCGRQGAKKYSFKGEAKPQLADPDHVQVISKNLFEKQAEDRVVRSMSLQPIITIRSRELDNFLFR